MKRAVWGCLFVLVLFSFYASYSTTSDKSSFFYAAWHNEHDDVCFKRVSEAMNNKYHHAVAATKTTTGASTMKTSPNHTLSILVQLSGEMGNNLGKIAYGICLKEWLREEFNTRSTIYLRHQNHQKWQRGHGDLNTCFAWTREFDFSAGNTPSIDNVLKLPPEWWDRMMKVNSHDATLVYEGLQFTVDAWKQGLYRNTTAPVILLDGKNLTVPFLYADRFANAHVCMDRYFDVITTLLRFDNGACCLEKPEPKESIFVSESGCPFRFRFVSGD